MLSIFLNFLKNEATFCSEEEMWAWLNWLHLNGMVHFSLHSYTKHLYCLRCVQKKEKRATDSSKWNKSNIIYYQVSEIVVVEDEHQKGFFPSVIIWAGWWSGYKWLKRVNKESWNWKFHIFPLFCSSHSVTTSVTVPPTVEMPWQKPLAMELYQSPVLNLRNVVIWELERHPVVTLIIK